MVNIVTRYREGIDRIKPGLRHPLGPPVRETTLAMWLRPLGRAQELRFAFDSPLEGAGFELPVPLAPVSL
jgi:hypothetical protein